MTGFDLGSLDLINPFVSDDGYTIRVLGEGATLGSPEAVVRSVVSMLADGEQAVYDRAGNRMASLPVEIAGSDSASLATGEAALRRELYRPNTVTWTPPDGYGPATVYDIITSRMEPVFDDIMELRTRRVFNVTLTCAPFARSADLTISSPLSVGVTPSTTVFDTCDSATGWTGTVDGVSTGVSNTFWGAGTVGIGELTSDFESPQVWQLTRTGVVDFTGLVYMTVRAGMVSYNTNLRAYADGVELPLIDSRLVSDRVLDYTFLIEDASVSSLVFSHTSTVGDVWQALVMHELSKSNMPPGASPRQLSRILPVGGTERTPGSIRIESPDGTTPLGLTLVHTCPYDGSGYSPPLQKWRSQGNARTPSSDSFSGNYEAINTTSWHADVPTSSLPSGGYAFMARLSSQAVGDVLVTWSTSTLFPGSTIQNGLISGQVLHTFTTINDWELVPIALLSLPSVRTSAGHVQFALRVDAASPIVSLDEAWAFRVDDDCALTIADVVAANLWIDSPSTSSPVSTVWVGDSREESRHPGPALMTPGANHVLHAGGTAAFTATEGVDWPLVSGEFHRRWHSNAAD